MYRPYGYHCFLFLHSHPYLVTYFHFFLGASFLCMVYFIQLVDFYSLILKCCFWIVLFWQIEFCGIFVAREYAFYHLIHTTIPLCRHANIHSYSFRLRHLPLCVFVHINPSACLPISSSSLISRNMYVLCTSIYFCVI